MFLLTFAIVYYCLISEQVTSNLSKLIADPSLPDKLFCSMDLFKHFSHQILFDGDSTMRALYYQVRLVLEHRACFSALVPLDPKYRASKIDTKNLEFKIAWVINFPKDFKSMQQYYRERFSTREYKIIIWNHGLHLLHLFPPRHMENLFLTKNFDWFMKLVMESVPKSTQCVIFRTTNPIAISKFYGEYYKYAKIYDDHNEAAIKKCMNEYHDYDVCEKAIFTNKGVLWLNEKIHRFVAEYKSEGQPKLVLMDSYSLFVNNGNYTEDGRHYTEIENLEVALLKATIEQKCGS